MIFLGIIIVCLIGYIIMLNGKIKQLEEVIQNRDKYR